MTFITDHILVTKLIILNGDILNAFQIVTTGSTNLAARRLRHPLPWADICTARET